MVMAGLLWYDDDNRRPLAAKVIEAVERYRERIGFEPTVCQLAPAQLTALATATASRSKRAHTPAVELPRALRLEPDEHLHPNYFMLGVGEGDIAIPITMHDDEIPRRTRRTTQAHNAYASGQTARKRTAPIKVAKTSAIESSESPLAPVTPVTRPVVATTSPKRRTAAKTASPVTAVKKKNEKVATVATPAATNLPKAKAARPARAKTMPVKPVTAKVVGPEKVTKAGKPAITRAKGAKGVVEKVATVARATATKVSKATTPIAVKSGKRVATKPVATKPTAVKRAISTAVKPARPSDPKSSSTKPAVKVAAPKTIKTPKTIKPAAAQVRKSGAKVVSEPAAKITRREAAKIPPKAETKVTKVAKISATRVTTKSPTKATPTKKTTAAPKMAKSVSARPAGRTTKAATRVSSATRGAKPASAPSNLSRPPPHGEGWPNRREHRGITPAVWVSRDY